MQLAIELLMLLPWQPRSTVGYTNMSF